MKEENIKPAVYGLLMPGLLLWNIASIGFYYETYEDQSSIAENVIELLMQNICFFLGASLGVSLCRTLNHDKKRRPTADASTSTPENWVNLPPIHTNHAALLENPLDPFVPAATQPASLRDPSVSAIFFL